MKINVVVMLKDGVFDPQAAVIGKTLSHLGYEEVAGVRQGKIIELEVPDGIDEGKIKEICEKILVNPVIESFHIEKPAR